jgi:hypothetical protein
LLMKENTNLRRALRTERQARSNYYYIDKDVAKEDLWTTK